jgi:hypothetical protein
MIAGHRDNLPASSLAKLASETPAGVTAGSLELADLTSRQEN